MTSPYDNISHLTSNKLYKILDESSLSHGKNVECGKLKRELNNNDDFLLFCMRVTGNLENYHNLEISRLFNEYRCKYLNLWVYKHISKFDKTTSTSIKSKILGIWDDYSVNINCTPEFIEYLYEDDYKKTKSLYDYALNYEMLKFDFMQNKKRCTKEDDKYIRENIDLYKQAKDYCKSDEEHRKHCSALKVIEKVYPNELSKLECNEIVTAETLKLLEGLSTEEDVCVKGQPTSVRQCATRKSLENAESAFADSQCEACICPNSSSSVAIVLPLLGSIFIFFILYKYTSLGTWLHSFLLRKKRSRLMDEEETQELLENTYDSTDRNTYNGGHNINYYPIQNS
ncbi:PIR Superfamily Protein [Plasmodium ovale wallikeri]|uniref:PIR Superfamily Protein n=1 Tax=Plasmodium ovale wallikeri TaxID=864142 RepID=A0A1A9AT27_PLAOA|nr:PIR Superfamily Protein [Plasmodium ovale wallikeri]